MNRNYIQKLIEKRRVGTLIKQITINKFNWSEDDFKYVFCLCLGTLRRPIINYNKLVRVIIFMMDNVDYYIKYQFYRIIERKAGVGYNPPPFDLPSLIRFDDIKWNNDVDLMKYILTGKKKKLYNKMKNLLLNTIPYGVYPTEHKYYVSKDVERFFIYDTEWEWHGAIMYGNDDVSSIKKYFTRDMLNRLYYLNKNKCEEILHRAIYNEGLTKYNVTSYLISNEVQDMYPQLNILISYLQK